ncbi:MAG: hypothetical protein CMJ78_15425 [Planctomycetaceae bacterium]|nr:hypothetical protein [Planctomycetaceae bacterium]
MKCLFKTVVFGLLLIVSSELLAANGWKAGVAKAIITPKDPVWMAGYGGRTRPADSKVHDIWIKVVAIEDAPGHRAVIMSSDTLGISRTIYDNVCESLKKKHNLDRSQIMLNSSHTHCGPVLRGALYDAYPLTPKEIARINDYSDWFERTVVDTVSSALKKLAPASIEVGHGSATFAVNRRNNREAEVPNIRQRGEKLKGPIDHAVPVLAVKDADGTMIAIVFGYACHNTTLGFYNWCGDYAGFAQYALEKKYPKAAAMFYMGCGADQNPLPRRTMELCQGYGERLAKAVDAVLSKPMKSMSAKLETRHSFLTLNYGAEPTEVELTKMAGDGNYRQRWAARLLKQKKAGKPFERTYRYPLQAWQIGGEQLWITMGGEVVVDYVLGIKKHHGANTWVAGYCNDVMAYIPSLRVLEEGGYEGNTSMMVYGVPAHRWAPDVETLIADEIDKLVKSLGQTGK